MSEEKEVTMRDIFTDDDIAEVSRIANIFQNVDINNVTNGYKYDKKAIDNLVKNSKKMRRR